MKLLFAVIFSFFLLPFSANAYIDTTVDGEAEATAGEQNTNLYRLNADNLSRLKRMRQIDNVLARNPNANIENSQEMEDLLSNKKQVDLDEQAQLAQMYKDTVARTKNKNALIVKNADDYRQVLQTAANSVKDVEVITNLKQRIRRR
ncbi:MAG: hypothetical protein MR350_07275 [Alphaproteobacteria bacterium]|nr:hypothetical protein [Alphaproteobacteria bacterium]